MKRYQAILALALAMGPAMSIASEPWLEWPDLLDEPRVIRVKLRQFRNEYWAEVVLHHDDTGRNHFLDHFVVITPEGRPVFKRFLEQPTPGGWPIKVNSCALQVPAGVNTIVFKAHCKIHGYSDATVTVDLTRPNGEDFEIVRESRKYMSRPGFVSKYFRKESRYAIDWYW